VAILWAYRKRGEPPPPQTTVGIGTAIQQQTNATAKAKSDLIERRLLLFAVITFFGHVLIACLMVHIVNHIKILSIIFYVRKKNIIDNIIMTA
jgi:hypothetical protein